MTEKIFSEFKKKKLVIIGTDDVGKSNLINKISEYNKTLSKNDETGEIKIEFHHKNFNYIIKILESTGFELNSNVELDLPSLNRCNGFIFLYNRNIPNSFNQLNNFITLYRQKIIGKKFFPCIFIQDDSRREGFHTDPTSISKKSLKNITENYHFPLLKVQNNFNKIEILKILNQIIIQILKEKKDEFPYNIIFNETYKLNCCLKYAKNLYYINILIFTFIIVLIYLIRVFLSMIYYSSLKQEIS